MAAACHDTLLRWSGRAVSVLNLSPVLGSCVPRGRKRRHAHTHNWLDIHWQMVSVRGGLLSGLLHKEENQHMYLLKSVGRLVPET